jgi:hypothetical protein
MSILLRQPPQLNYPRATVFELVILKLDTKFSQGGISLVASTAASAAASKAPTYAKQEKSCINDTL